MEFLIEDLIWDLSVIHLLSTFPPSCAVPLFINQSKSYLVLSISVRLFLIGNISTGFNDCRGGGAGFPTSEAPSHAFQETGHDY